MSAAAAEHVAAAAADPFPWTEAMAAGLGILRHPPDVFWRMTPREFERAVSPFVRSAAQALSRAGLETLMDRFPDRGR